MCIYSPTYDGHPSALRELQRLHGGDIIAGGISRTQALNGKHTLHSGPGHAQHPQRTKKSQLNTRRSVHECNQRACWMSQTTTSKQILD